MGIRFAPSPTGAFHVGNFRTAWISWSWSRALGKPWVVRVEDIDAPRVLAGASERQLAELKRLGLVPDSTIVQSERAGRHLELFEAGVRQGAIYPCFCSRKELATLASAPHGETPKYSGRCRALTPAEARHASRAHVAPTLAWRFRSEDTTGRDDVVIARTSPKLSETAQPLESTTFTPAYHWACAIDDWDGRYDLLVRAADLAGVAETQRRIQRWVARTEGRAYVPQAIFHCSLVVSNDGHRLEKRTRGVTLDELQARGIGPDELRSKFEASFRVEEHVFEPGKVFAERKETLTLAELTL